MMNGRPTTPTSQIILQVMRWLELRQRSTRPRPLLLLPPPCDLRCCVCRAALSWKADEALYRVRLSLHESIQLDFALRWVLIQLHSAMIIWNRTVTQSSGFCCIACITKSSSVKKNSAEGSNSVCAQHLFCFDPEESASNHRIGSLFRLTASPAWGPLNTMAAYSSQKLSVAAVRNREWTLRLRHPVSILLSTP